MSFLHPESDILPGIMSQRQTKYPIDQCRESRDSELPDQTPSVSRKLFVRDCLPFESHWKDLTLTDVNPGGTLYGVQGTFMHYTHGNPSCYTCSVIESLIKTGKMGHMEAPDCRIPGCNP